MSNALEFVVLTAAGLLNRQRVTTCVSKRGCNAPPLWSAGDGLFSGHYHREWNHQGLGNKIIEPGVGYGGEGEVNCLERLGGLLGYCHWDAA